MTTDGVPAAEGWAEVAVLGVVRGAVDRTLIIIPNDNLRRAGIRPQNRCIRASGDDRRMSFGIHVSAPIETVEVNGLAKIREDLLLACVRAVEEAGARAWLFRRARS